jgi:hypothetical protein
MAQSDGIDVAVGTQTPVPGTEGLNNPGVASDDFEHQLDSVEQQVQAVYSHEYQEDEDEGLAHRDHNANGEAIEEEFLNHDQDTPVASVEQQDAPDILMHNSSEQAPQIDENDSTSLFIPEKGHSPLRIGPRQTYEPSVTLCLPSPEEAWYLNLQRNQNHAEKEAGTKACRQQTEFEISYQHQP